MEWLQNITNKRRGRPAKNTNDAGSANAVQAAIQIDSGNGQVSSNGANEAAKTGGTGKALDWRGLVEAVTAESGLVSTAWHPEPESELIGTNASDVRVQVGDQAYQLSTGEIIKL